MNATAMPAYRPTANCIWSSFRSSGKRHLLLTGGRGTGKTTLLRQLFPEKMPGLTTWAQPGTGVFLRENGTGEEAQIGIFDPALPGTENRMRPVQAGFHFLGIPALDRCAQAQGDWVAVDEVGYLEEHCPNYHSSLHRLMETKRLAAVIRKQELPLLGQLGGRQDVFTVDLDGPFGNIGCVIMASGMGRRFGGNKLMADFRGEPMLCRALAATQGIFARRVVVTRHREVAGLCRELGVETVLHDLPHRSDTVRLGLERLEGVERCMFCPGDQPLLTRDTVAALALSAANAPEFIWRASFQGVPGSPAVFPGWALPELCRLPEGSGGGSLIKKYPEHLRLTDVRDRYELLDADTPEDLALLAER